MRVLLALLGLLMSAAAASAQRLPPKPPPPPPPAAPLLYVRLLGPDGATATFYPDAGRRPTATLPAQIGLRPGYTYRFKLAGLGIDGKDTLFPTVEVIGSLHMPCWTAADKHPVPIHFRADEIERALKGSFFTKVYLIEHPDRAEPIATIRDDPLELQVPAELNLLDEARTQGRPLVVVRFGQRQFSDEELNAHAIPGTILTPEDKLLPMPAVPPHVPYSCYPFFDPYLGPRRPEEECMYDGGDTSPPAGFDPAGMLAGLDPSDSVAEYKNSKGEKRLAVSNRVCICVPRFAVVKTEIVAEMYDRPYGPQSVLRAEAPPILQMRIPSLTAQQTEQPEVVRNREQPSVVVEAEGPFIIDQLIGPGLVIAEVGSKVVVGLSSEECPPVEAPLVLCKRHDTPCGQIGDIVTFYLSYTNPGTTPINDVTVSDSLTGRLEYVPGSQKADRDAVFSTQENEAGSVILRWQIKGTLLPGHSGTVSFQAKIR